MAGMAALLALSVAFVIDSLIRLPLDGGLVRNHPPSSVTFLDGRGEAFAARGIGRGETLTAAEVPPDLKNAVVAVEDRRFYRHGGIDLRGIARAAFRNLLAGEAREGASTITQQLARMHYLTSEKTLRRKLQEAIIAVWLEHKLDKAQILTRYLNTAYFGAGAYGVDAAAKRYFGKGAGDLSLPEAAMIAGLVRAPSALSPVRNYDAAWERARLILTTMVDTGSITREQAEAARRDGPRLRMPIETPAGNNYFVDAAEATARQLTGVETADLSVSTTFDPQLQAEAERVVAKWLGARGAADKVRQAALVAMTYDGAVLALVGGRDYEESQFNRALQARRQAGSLFKIFVYLAALERGASPGDLVIDRPVKIGDWEPQNYEGGFRGRLSLETAFARSVNSVAVQVSQAVGISQIIDVARRLGIETPLPPVPSLALGTADVTLVEVTAAFAAVASGIEGRRPYLVREIRNGDRLLYRRPEQSGAPLSETARAALIELLTAVVRGGTGKVAQSITQAAGKTGTTQDYRDAWFVGFTPSFVVGVWVGNDDNSPMHGVTGGGLPTFIWRDFVAAVETGPSQPMVAARKPALLASASGSTAEQREVLPIESPEIVRGRPRVLNTGTLSIKRRRIPLEGVVGKPGSAARAFKRYLQGKEVECKPVEGRPTFRCRAGSIDLSEAVLFNGGGQAAPDAPTELRAAEEQARAARVGIWR